MTKLVDTNILVYRYDPRYPTKQAIATDLLRSGLISGELVLCHQTIIEFVAAVSRPRKDLRDQPLLEPLDAYAAAEEWSRQYHVLFPDQAVLETALRGVSAYRLSWFDAHLWATAEVNSIPEIITEDFEHGRYYGSVRTVNPLLEAVDEVHELPAMYAARAAPTESRSH